MKVYILFLSCKTMGAILGVYSSKEEADQVLKDFSKNLSGSSCVNVFIVEREVV